MRLASVLITALLASTAQVADATTLDEAVAAALAHAPGMQAAIADSDTAKARLDRAKAERMPSVTLSGTIGYGRLDPKNYFGLQAQNVTPRAGQVTIEQPLFTGGRIGAGIAQARAGADAGKAGQDMVRSQLIASVAQAYGDVLTARQIVALHERLVTETGEIERQAKLRFKAGESPSTDVSQAAARRAEAQAGMARAQGMEVSARAHFANLTGLAADDLQPLPQNPAVPATLEEAMDAAMQHSPMLAQAAAGLKAAEAAERGAKAESLPTVGAFAEGASVRDQFFPGYIGDSATVGVRARWTLFAGGRVAGKIAEASSALRAARARYDEARNAVEEQVIAGFQNVRTSLLVEQAAEEQAASAGQALTSVRHEVRVGMKPQLDLLDAEREAIGAASAAAAARTDRIVAAYRLLSLIGQN